MNDIGYWKTFMYVCIRFEFVNSIIQDQTYQHILTTLKLNENISFRHIYTFIGTYAHLAKYSGWAFI